MDEQRLQQYWNLIQELLRRLLGVITWLPEKIADTGKASAEWLRMMPKLVQQIAQWQQLNEQAVELYHQGKFDDAVIVAEQALELTLSLNHGDHPAVATSLNNLAELYRSQGRYEQAEPLYEQALDMIKRLFNGDHPAVATSLNNLAGLYYSQGRYEQAEPLLKQALEMIKRLFNGDHPAVATSLNNLAGLYESQGRYEQAEPLLKQALEMRKRLFNGDHPDVASSLNNLALLYESQGRYEQAEPLYEQALEMWKRLFNGDHPDVATSLNNLALLYYSQGRYEQAEPLYEQALEMIKRLFNGDHPAVATSLNNLAGLYESQGRYEQAEPLYEQALEMRKRLFNGDHPDVATSLNNLAGLYKSQGRYEQAEPLYEQALEMIKRLFNGDHPDVATSLNNLALLLAVTHRPAEALELMREADEVENRIISRVFAASSDRDRLHHLQTIRKNFDALLSLVLQYFPDSPDAVQIALDVTLRRKSLTASALATFNYALYSDRYPNLTPEFEQWRTLRAEIVHLIFSPPLPNPNLSSAEFEAQQATHKQRLSNLESKCDNLEKRLASQVPELELLQAKCDRQTVAAELPKDAVLIEFVCFRAFDLNSPKEQRWQPARYAAFVLPAQQENAVKRMIDLGSTAEIDDLIEEFRQASAKPKLNDLGARSKKQKPTEIQPKSYTVAGIKLRQAIYDPIRAEIGECQHLILAPDGDLNLVPFHTLPLDETGNTLLMDKYQISYLSSGRDILRGKMPSKRQAAKALIIADPNFNLGAEVETLHVTSLLPKTMTPSQVLNTLSGDYFHPASETKFLGESVANKLGVKPYMQDDALESHLLNSHCPRILLVATHGYFAQEKQQAYLNLFRQLVNSPNDEAREILLAHPHLLDQHLLSTMKSVAIMLAENGHQNLANWLQNFAIVLLLEILDKISQDRQDRLANTQLENPMMRSGIALAGANTWLSGGTLPEKAGKGLLFAQDIAALDLWENELAVLVACESGIGDVKLGEGVFGMRRAFAVAGCKTLVMSLWKVPEKASVLLMDRFFDSLAVGKGRGEALLEAQNYIRTITVRSLKASELGLKVLDELAEIKVLLPENRDSQLDYQPLQHPYFWAAWVCQGDTGSFKL
jgi:tetratricopeptide (TPR) repeat protein/CHAT domain-containing protein